MASEKIAQLIEEVKVLSVLELSELVHALEEEFGVSAAAAVAAGRTTAAALLVDVISLNPADLFAGGLNLHPVGRDVLNRCGCGRTKRVEDGTAVSRIANIDVRCIHFHRVGCDGNEGLHDITSTIGAVSRLIPAVIAADCRNTKHSASGNRRDNSAARGSLLSEFQLATKNNTICHKGKHLLCFYVQ